MGKDFEKQTKTTADQQRKKIDALKVLKPGTHHLIIKDFQQINQMKNKFKKNKEIKKMVNREDLIFEKKNYKKNIFTISNNLKHFVFLHIVKVLDKFWHQIVILKLKQNCITRNLLKIIEVILSNRY